MRNGLLLWADDEIEHLKAHVIFLQKKGYEVVTVSNGRDAITECERQAFDLVLLDEMMPGLSGLATLQRIKEVQPNVPVVMVTKSEEEDIMNQAIGKKIADYLIKPVNPNQILLSLKKNIHHKAIVAEVTQMDYQQSFQQIAMQIADCRSWQEWTDVYRRLVHWELELAQLPTHDSPLLDILTQQKEEANNSFAKFIMKNYEQWMDDIVKPGHRDESRPLMSTEVMKHTVFPAVDKGQKVCLVVFDNFRYDQWKAIAPELSDLFDIDEQLYYSILPTSTQYARNAIFSGLMPDSIARMFPDLWVDEDEEEGKNLNEEPLIQTQLDRFRRRDTFSYHKINDSSAAERLLQRFSDLRRNDFNVVVFNFIDMLSHARTESKMVRELANSEKAYRSITLSWFRHSAVNDFFKRLAAEGYHVVITTDHGSIRVTRPVKIVGERNTNTNLRYKLGRNLGYDSRDIYVVKNPQRIHLPQPNVSTSYVFAQGDRFFAYPNNYNHYVQYYRNTFQHGGISMEEVIVPLIRLDVRGER
ncbi:MAG: PglZ domain-containing protein [Prevotella sp.]